MLYIMSDIHGLYQRYKAMLEKIDFKDEDKLYVLGDVIDRGPESFETLFDIMSRDNVEMFLGNHEHMMLTFLNGTDQESWFYGVNGGQFTYYRYRQFDDRTRSDITDYLLNKTTIIRNLMINDKKYILSHTGAFDDGIDRFTKDYQDDLMKIQDMVWNMGIDTIDSIALRNAPSIRTTFISGHIISRRLHDDDTIYVEEYPNGYTWMDIDCGCAMGENYGYLSCVAIDDEGNIADVYYVD